MKAKSLSVFRTKLRYTDEGTVLVTIGQVIEGDDEHLRSLARNRLVELLPDGETAKTAKPKGETPPKDKAKQTTSAKPGAAAKPAKPKQEQAAAINGEDQGAVEGKE